MTYSLFFLISVVRLLHPWRPINDAYVSLAVNELGLATIGQKMLESAINLNRKHLCCQTHHPLFAFLFCGSQIKLFCAPRLADWLALPSFPAPLVFLLPVRDQSTSTFITHVPEIREWPRMPMNTLHAVPHMFLGQIYNIIPATRRVGSDWNLAIPSNEMEEKKNNQDEYSCV